MQEAATCASPAGGRRGLNSAPAGESQVAEGCYEGTLPSGGNPDKLQQKHTHSYTLQRFIGYRLHKHRLCSMDLRTHLQSVCRLGAELFFCVYSTPLFCLILLLAPLRLCAFGCILSGCCPWPLKHNLFLCLWICQCTTVL